VRCSFKSVLGFFSLQEESSMKVVAVLSLVALTLAGCASSTPREQRALTGAGVGAVAGAIIGGVATGRPAGAAAGGIIGAASGAVIADVTRPREECVRVRYDQYGNAVCTRWRQLD
jgi:osmotically inducible lipoprotein OsmB